MSFPHALLTGLLLVALGLTGCKRGSETTLAPEAPKGDPALFARAGLTAPTTAPGMPEPGTVDIPALRDAVADPQPITEPELWRLVQETNWAHEQRRGGERPHASRPEAAQSARPGLTTFGAEDGEDETLAPEPIPAETPPPPPPPPPAPASAPRNEPPAKVRAKAAAKSPAPSGRASSDGREELERPLRRERPQAYMMEDEAPPDAKLERAPVLEQKRREIIQIIKGNAAERPSASAGGSPPPARNAPKPVASAAPASPR
jgi:hypothetical protein